MDSEAEHLLNIDTHIRRAEGLLALAHVDVEDEENYNDEYERIYHCEVCLVREVLETVWPSIEQYVDWLKSQIPDKSKLNEG